MKKINLLFSDYFQVEQKAVDTYGAFNISLVADLPLFIDPFLLFNSTKGKYKELHKEIIKYLRFLRDKSVEGKLDKDSLGLYKFGEVKQTWLGFSESGNRGRGLGKFFALSLDRNFGKLFSGFGKEQISKGAHLEKLTLIKVGIGKDTISDFTTNLIKGYLLEYTQTFTRRYVSRKKCSIFGVRKTRFNYETETWESKQFLLPEFQGEYVLLTPKDILTKGDVWINRSDLLNQLKFVIAVLPNRELRAKVNAYLRKVLSRSPTAEEKKKATEKTISQFPELLDYYIQKKENSGSQAVKLSSNHVKLSEDIYLDGSKKLALLLSKTSDFYRKFPTTLEEVRERVLWIKHVIEKQDGYTIFYKNKKLIGREKDLQVMVKIVWYGSVSDLSPEINAGRGPADFKSSRGALDKTMIETKLASNPRLKDNLRSQQEVHKSANRTKKGIKVILFFTKSEKEKINRVLKELGLSNDENIIVIDARQDNKPSASRT